MQQPLMRQQEFYFYGMRIVPSYVATGGNLLIEKSKRALLVSDLQKGLERI